MVMCVIFVALVNNTVDCVVIKSSSLYAKGLMLTSHWFTCLILFSFVLNCSHFQTFMSFFFFFFFQLIQLWCWWMIWSVFRSLPTSLFFSSPVHLSPKAAKFWIVSHLNIPSSGSSVVVCNPENLESDIFFWILPSSNVSNLITT